MTVENQNFETLVETENVYRGSKWQLWKVLGIFAIVAVTMIIRDMGMMWVYGSIFDKLMEDPSKMYEVKIGFMNYFYMIILFAIPLVFPLIMRFRGGVYYDEPENSLIPNVNKWVALAIYVIFGLILGVSVVLCFAGAFTVAHLFVLINMALIFFSSVTIFYYFGTFVLQRAKMSTTAKYIIPTALMIGTTAVSTLGTIGLSKIIDFKIVTYINAFKETFADNMSELTTPLFISIAVIAVGVWVSGLIYQLTRNILYAVTPTLVLSFGSIVLVNRIREAVKYIASTPELIEKEEKNLLRATNDKRKATILAKIEEYKAGMDKAEVGEKAGYVFIAIFAVVLLVLLCRCVFVIIKTCREKKNNG